MAMGNTTRLLEALFLIIKSVADKRRRTNNKGGLPSGNPSPSGAGVVYMYLYIFPTTCQTCLTRHHRTCVVDSLNMYEVI